VPSFINLLRFRIKYAVVFFLIFCFLVGFVRSVFAGSLMNIHPGIVWHNATYGTDCYALGSYQNGADDDPTGTYYRAGQNWRKYTDVNGHDALEYDSIDLGGGNVDYKRLFVYLFFWNTTTQHWENTGTGQIQIDANMHTGLGQWYALEGTDFMLGHTHYSTSPNGMAGDLDVLYPQGCEAAPSCEVEIEEMNVACGGEDNIAEFDDELCTGYCITCTALDAKESAFCEETDQILSFFHCTGDTLQPQSLSYAIGECIDPNDCDGLLQTCENTCGAGNIYTFACENGELTEACECGNNLPLNYDPDEFAGGVPDGTGDPETVAPPVAGTNDENTENIAKNTANVSDNSGEVAANTKATADNTKKIGTLLDKELSELNENMNDLKNDLSGPAVEVPDLGEAYEVTSPEISIYSNRFSAFVDSMRSTSIFGAVDDLAGEIPSSNDSTIDLDLGSYGEAQIDLSAYSSAFAVLRSILLIMASVSAIFIITKGGGG
jgi:hypothetical protein